METYRIHIYEKTKHFAAASLWDHDCLQFESIWIAEEPGLSLRCNKWASTKVTQIISFFSQTPLVKTVFPCKDGFWDFDQCNCCWYLSCLTLWFVETTLIFREAMQIRTKAWRNHKTNNWISDATVDIFCIEKLL